MTRFTKMQGSGNDFVVVETNNAQRDWSQMAVTMCDRHYGVGADSLLLLLPSDRADFRMRVFDRDGSEAEACGNGLMCLAKYYVDERAANSTNREVSVETITGIRQAEVYRLERNVTNVKTGMGKPQFGAKYIPVVIKQGEGNIVDIKSMINYPITVDDKQLRLNLVSMGNPHAVCFCPDSVSDFPLSRLGPQVENLSIFPNRINFEVARVLNRQQIEARVWERGVGETLACGTGACAITVAAHQHDYIDDKVNVKLPGGILEMEWDGVGEVFLSGPAETVFTGEWPD